MWGTNEAAERSALRRLAGILAQEYKVKIEIDNTTERAVYDAGEKTLTLGTRDIVKRGGEHYAGLLLHEVGHIRHTPENAKGSVEPKLRGVYNLLEDCRIDELMRGEYEGAEYYLERAYAPVAQDFAWELSEPPFEHGATLGEILGDEEKAGAIKDELYRRTFALAWLHSRGESTGYMKVGVLECEGMARELSELMMRAQYASKREIVVITKKAGKILAPILPEAEACGSVLKMKGGLSPLGESGAVHADKRFTEMDALASEQVGAMKRKLVAALRENERTRYEHGKRKGVLDKKALHKTARRNYRVYQKRVIPKGKKYAAQIVLDASGSMWSVSHKRTERGDLRRSRRFKIDTGLYSTALLARSLRSLGYPTGMVFYGSEAVSVLDPREVYGREAMQGRIDRLNSNYYNSRENETHKGITEALPRLLQVSVGRTPLLIVITDGGLVRDDCKKSSSLIEAARRKGVHTCIFYVEDGTERILGDANREMLVEDADELPERCAALVRKVVYQEVEAS